MTPKEDLNRRMLRAKDVMDRRFAEPLDIERLAAVAFVSPAHFIRVFKLTFGETPHQYLRRRRIERAAAMLRGTTVSVAQVSTAVGFGSFSTFTRTFGELMGETPTAHRSRSDDQRVPTCMVKALRRPGPGGAQSSSFGQADDGARR